MSYETPEPTLRGVIGRIDALAKITADGLTELKTELAGTIDTLRADTNAGFDRIDRRLGRIETRLEVVEEKQKA